MFTVCLLYEWDLVAAERELLDAVTDWHLNVKAALLKRENSSSRAAPGFRNGGRYRIRTYDFHRVKMALYR
jgi:hypothetical protein